ncbi:MAG TPA: MdtA/MuxA family multidrug efflux RND transporter periplasmic adaptor subunit [Rhizomicrobium sp.]|jgi:multidrug efflux system membrane fusion protein
MSPDKSPDTAQHVPTSDKGSLRRWFDLYAVRIGVIVVVVLAVIFLIRFLAHNQPTQQRGGRFGDAQPVGVAKVTQGSMPITLNALGTVTPLATVTVRPQVSGPVMSFHFAEGQMVKKGDVLAEIDPRPFQAALYQAQGQLLRDRAALANAIVDLNRYRMLWAAKSISQQQVATQEALVKQDQGVVVSDEGGVAAAELNLSYCRITSPVDGRAGIRQVDIGNLVQAGQANGIVVVTQINPMSVIFSIPEDNIDPIVDRMNAGATLQADAYDRAQAKKLASGTLSAVDSAIDTTTGTVKLRALFDNTDNALFPNQFVNIHLLIDTQQNQALAPVAAIQRGAQGTFVFIASPDKTVAMRTVKTGATDGTNVVITNGLKPGDTIVVDGADRLSDGAAIEIPAAPKAGIAAPSAAPAGQAPPPVNRQDRFQRMLKRLPPAQQEELKKMTPEQRRDWFREHRNEFRHRSGQ